MKLLKKWLALINRSYGLSKEELQNKYVCHKHFEKRFFNSFRFKISVYPTLITQEKVDKY